MKNAFAIVNILLVLTPLNVLAQEFELTIELGIIELGKFELSIGEDKAFVRYGGSQDVYDLKNKRWKRSGADSWVTLDQYKKWAKTTKEKAINKKTKTSPEHQKLVKWELAPKFKVTEEKGKLILTSGVVDYTVTVEKTDRDLSHFFQFARLYEYQWAMTEETLPRLAELIVLEELEKRKLLPVAILKDVKVFPKAPPTSKRLYKEKKKSS